jgi:two-component system, NtrC family, C4-dicarboxylate transport response regulator DctD
MNSPSVLVLDDDTAICRIVSQMLSLESYQVRTSQSIEEAVAAIKGKPFDAYILDHRLREGSGLDVAERLRADGSNAPIILISGYDVTGVAARAQALGVFDTIQKPFSAEELCGTLKKSLESTPAVHLNTVHTETDAKRLKARKRLIKNFGIGALFVFLIVIGVAIYLLTAPH